MGFHAADSRQTVHTREGTRRSGKAGNLTLSYHEAGETTAVGGGLPLVMLHDRELYTLTLGLASFNAGMQSYTFWSGLMAAATMTVGPVVIAFFLAQRYFIQGIATAGLKG